MSNVDISRYSKRLVQLFWDPEPKVDNASNLPIWCLGRKYEIEFTTKPTESVTNTLSIGDEATDAEGQDKLSGHGSIERQISSFEQVDRVNGQNALAQVEGLGWPKEFVDDLEARIWLTYRSNFPPIAKSDNPKASAGMSFPVRLKYQMAGQNGFTSDTGWGCMIRSGQCLLANAIALHRFGRARIRDSNQLEEHRLLGLFADDPRAPFSIHNFVDHGALACGTFPGQWFGPSATATCIQALSNKNDIAGLKVYVTGDGPDVYEDALMKLAKPDGIIFLPMLLLVGTRLGIERITPVYGDALKASLQMPQAVGIAGGRPSSSHYFVGTQGDQFFYLDPHYTRPALPYRESNEEYTAEEVESCHTRRLRRIDIKDMDPSMLIAFLFRTEEDWRLWRSAVSQAPGKAIFHVADSKPSHYGSTPERESALDEVEAFDDETDDGLE